MLIESNGTRLGSRTLAVAAAFLVVSVAVAQESNVAGLAGDEAALASASSSSESDEPLAGFAAADATGTVAPESAPQSRYLGDQGDFPVWAASSSSGGLDSEGWTQFSESSDTLTIYVSSSAGHDQHDGLSPSSPKRTLAAGIALLRHGFPDWLLLQRGDVWHESLGHWKKSGRSKHEPMLVSTFGHEIARPLLLTGKTRGLWTHGGSGSPASIDNLAIVGLHFQADGFKGNGNCVGLELFQPSANLLVEDCAFEAYSTNLVFQGLGGRHANIKLRRSVVVDAYSIHGTGAHPQGLYAFAVDGLLIEENVFDHNGWNEHVSGAGADIFSHNIYIDNDNSGVEVRGNIISNASSHGMQLRSGGVAAHNLFVRNSIALSLGGGNDPAVNGVKVDVRGNVILDGKDIDASNPRGWALWFGNIAAGSVTCNVVANNALGMQPAPLTLDGTHVGDNHASIGVHDLVIDRNIIFNWGGGVRVQGDSQQITDIDLMQVDLQNLIDTNPLLDIFVAATTASLRLADNRFFCKLALPSGWTQVGYAYFPVPQLMAAMGDTTSKVEQVPYPDPERSVASYNVELGGSFSHDEFMSEARQQSRANWRPEYRATSVNRYMRKGFLQ